MKSLKYGGVESDEAEVVIRLDKTDGMAHVSSTWAAWSRKLERRHGLPKRYRERDGVITSAFWVIPLASITIRTAKKAPRTPPQINPTVQDLGKSGSFGRKYPKQVS